MNRDEAKPWDGMTFWWRRAKAAEAKLAQLRTNEAIEQAADILSFETTGGCYPKADEQCRHVMRRVLNTLLGEDQ